MNFNNFEFESVINEDGRNKHLALHLKKENKDAIALLNKLPFNSANSFEQLVSGLKPFDSNDIYHRFINHDAGFVCKVIYPATPAHIKKYSETKPENGT
mgnify:CR=1 FL=1